MRRIENKGVERMDLIKKSNLMGFLLICLLIIGSLALINSVSANELDYCLDDSNLDLSTSVNDDSSLSSVVNDGNIESDLKDSNTESDENLVYVSNNGDDSNSGLSESDAYLTVDKALENYYLNNKSITIYLDEGTFKSEDNYQIFAPDDVESHSISIIGSGVNKTILDGEGLHNIFKIESGMSVLLKDLTLINIL